MKGRSVDQIVGYEESLAGLVDLLEVAPMSVREIREALARAGERPSAATVYAWVKVLAVRGEIRSRKRRCKIPGKTGQRERVFFVTGESGC